MDSSCSSRFNMNADSTTRTATVVGAGIGGLSAAIRLQSLGFQTTLVDRQSCAGGRAAVRQVDGFTFDMGPTVITVPHFIEELFACGVGDSRLWQPDFPAEVRRQHLYSTSETSGGPATSRYVKIVPLLPFYRIYFDDGTYFDYDGDQEHTMSQLARLAPEDLGGYEVFHEKSKAIFERGFLELGYTRFESVSDMLKVVPDLMRLDAVRPLFSLVSSCFSNPKTRQIFSFEPLLIGGNPLTVPAIYAMIHFVEKHWGIHFAVGGTGALVRGLIQKFEELGGKVVLGKTVTKINIAGSGRSKRVSGIQLDDGSSWDASVVVSNGDYVNTVKNLIDPKHRRTRPDWVLNRLAQSMSLVVVYFGFDGTDLDLNIKHHNIIFGPRYEPLLREIFNDRKLGPDFSMYLHVPTLTDPTLAPAGCHAAYTLVPVPNKKSGIDWGIAGPKIADRVLEILDTRGYIPNLRDRLRTCFHVTPDYFENDLLSFQGNAFGLEPRLTQSAYFRPHNRSFINGLYFVGANAQPGGGMPSVMMSAKMTARAVAEDHGLAPARAALSAANPSPSLAAPHETV
jgi:phytoene desaturase